MLKISDAVEHLKGFDYSVPKTGDEMIDKYIDQVYLISLETTAVKVMLVAHEVTDTYHYAWWTIVDKDFNHHDVEIMTDCVDIKYGEFGNFHLVVRQDGFRMIIDDEE